MHLCAIVAAISDTLAHCWTCKPAKEQRPDKSHVVVAFCRPSRQRHKGKGADMLVSYTYNVSAVYEFATTNEVLRLRRRLPYC